MSTQAYRKKKGPSGVALAFIIFLAVIVFLIAFILIVMNLAPSTPVIDMAKIQSEINSHRTTDFTESSKETDYVKITVKDHGDIVIRLRPDIAPETVENFKDLVSKGFYNGLTFHRIYKNFMIQGGDPDGDGTGDSGKEIKGEFTSNGFKNDLQHVRGVISMARGPEPNSASCQFFICDATSSHLDNNYASFGYVMAGMSTVDSIAAVEVKDNGRGEKSDPVKDVIIEKIVFVKDSHNH